MADDTMPRLGVSLPTLGPHAGPDAIVTVATAAERLGFDSVSASERLLLPAGPDWRNEAGLPDSYVWDSLETLTWAASHTTRVRLLTAVVISLFQPPIVLARRLATIDQLHDVLAAAPIAARHWYPCGPIGTARKPVRSGVGRAPRNWCPSGPSSTARIPVRSHAAVGRARRAV